MSPEVPVILLVLAIPLFFFWRWLMRKWMLNSGARIPVTILATLITTPLLYGGLIALWIFTISYYPDRDFDKNEWATNQELRYELTEDLIDNELLIGKTKAEVAELLGENSEPQHDVWHYCVGFVPKLFNLDPDILEITFRDGKVVEVRQYTS